MIISRRKSTPMLALMTILGTVFFAGLPLAAHAAQMDSGADTQVSDARYRTMEIQGIDIAYREAGDSSRPTIVLLHGFPTSSHMFRELIPQLAERYHVIAPDYPGFGASEMPALNEFDYSFANFAKVVDGFLQKEGYWEILTIHDGLRRAGRLSTVRQASQTRHRLRDSKRQCL